MVIGLIQLIGIAGAYSKLENMFALKLGFISGANLLELAKIEGQLPS